MLIINEADNLNAREICLMDLLPYPTPPGHSAFCPLQLHSQPGRYISQHPQAEPVESAARSLLKRNTQKTKNVLYMPVFYLPVQN